MAPGSLSAVCSPLMKRPPLTGCVEKRSWPGDGRDCFLCIGSMIKGRRCSHHLISTLLGRMLTNLQTHAHHAQGVQYATKSFVWGVYALQTRGATPIDAMKSAKSAFQRGWFSS